MKLRMRTWVYALLLTILIGLAVLALQKSGVPGKKEKPADASKPHVVATFFPLYDYARNIGGDKITLTLLFAQTPEVASFSPAEIETINTADLVIKNGVGLEPVLEDLITASDNKNVTVTDLSRGISIRENDPHVWLNPQNAAIQVQNILDALVALDPQNAGVYQKNAERYIGELMELDGELEEKIAAFPHKNFIAFHSAFQYFAERYGLKQVAVIEEFPGKEPSPRDLADIIKTIQEKNARAIFSEPQFSPRIAETIAKDTGLTVYALNPVETGNPATDSYVSLMRKNLETLQTALR